MTGPAGATWSVGHPAVDTVGSTVLTAPVRPDGPAGRYTIGYRVVSADGHPVSGTVRFTLTNPVSGTIPSRGPQPATSTSAPQATAADKGENSGDVGGEAPVWPWIGGAAVLVGIGLVVALRIGRSTGL